MRICKACGARISTDICQYCGDIGTDIKVEYDGRYPNLCAGNLFVTVNGTQYRFKPHTIRSGGSVWFDEGWSEHVEHGPWYIDDEAWPEHFSIPLRIAVMEAINNSIEHGCCGGCI